MARRKALTDDQCVAAYEIYDALCAEASAMPGKIRRYYSRGIVKRVYGIVCSLTAKRISLTTAYSVIHRGQNLMLEEQGDGKEESKQ